MVVTGVTRARLTREAIVAEARELLDEHGYDALSMRAVAERLSSSPMALYRYVENRGELEVAVARAVSTEFALEDDPATEPEAAIAAWMREMRAHWLRHPWFGHLLGQHAELADFMVAVGTRLGRALQRAGADDRLVAQEVIRITRTTLGVVLIEQAAPLARRAGRSLPRPSTDVAASLARLVESYDDDAFFEHLIHTTIAGFRARLAESAPGQGDVHVHH